MKTPAIVSRTIFGVILIVLLVFGYVFWMSGSWGFRENRLVRILHVDSYHDGYGWSDGQLTGFIHAFGESGFDFELQRFEIDAERNKEEDFLKLRGEEALELIDSFDPDLLFVTDDKAQEYVGQHFAGTDIPLVYSGIVYPADYGYDTAKNVAGVLEIYPFAKGIEFFKSVFPYAKNVLLVTNPTPTGLGLFEIARNQAQEFPDMVFEFTTAETFQEYQDIVLSHQDFDCLIEIPLMNFEDESGEIVSTRMIQEWTIENSQIPDMTYFDVLDYDGVLLKYAYSPEWDGQRAGEIAIQILAEGRTPSSLAGEIVDHGKKIINLRRAETLGISQENIPSSILVNSKVLKTFPWE